MGEKYDGLRSLVDIRLQVGNRGVRTKVRISEYGERDAQKVDEEIGGVVGGPLALCYSWKPHKGGQSA